MYLCRYSWCSKRLFKKSVSDANRSLSLDDLIPLETCSHESGAGISRREIPRLIVGHNVSFDRSFIKEQYFVQVKAFIVDMISFHIIYQFCLSLLKTVYWIMHKFIIFCNMICELPWCIRSFDTISMWMNHMLPVCQFQFRLANNCRGGLRASVEIFSVPDFRDIGLDARGALEAGKVTSLEDKRWTCVIK